MKKPFNDSYLTYNYLLHRYELTEQAAFVELGINFGELSNIPNADSNPSTLGTRMLKRVSSLVYNYLLADCQNTAWLQFELATVPELRSVVLEMLLRQAEYMNANGDLSTFSGVDIYKGQAMERGKLTEAAIAPQVEAIAYRIQPCLGRCLKYAGSFGGYAPFYLDKDGNPVY